MLTIDIFCERCHARIGKAKAFAYFNLRFGGRGEARYLQLDPEDVAYWRRQHTREICNGIIAENRARFEQEHAEELAQQKRDAERANKLWQLRQLCREADDLVTGMEQAGFDTTQALRCAGDLHAVLQAEELE